MIIKDLQVSKQTIPLKTPFKTALRTATEIESIEVKLVLENGLIGRGAAAPTPVITGDSTDSILYALTGPIKEAVKGMDLSAFSIVLQRIQSSCIGNTSAKAAADIACHDAYCKLIGIPLNAFLGGSIPLQTSMTVGVESPEDMAASAKEKAAEGFRFLKIKVGANPDLDLERMEAVSKAVPASVKLRLDANQAWKPKQAVQLIQEMQKRGYPVEFVEQPVAAADFEGLKYVTDHVSLPIMADESLFSPRDAMKLVSGRYVDLLNIKLMKSGGIANAWTIASLAETNGVACMMGCMMEPPLSVAAAAHTAAAHPNILYFDLDAPLWLSEEPDFLHYSGDQVKIMGGSGIGSAQKAGSGFNPFH